MAVSAERSARPVSRCDDAAVHDPDTAVTEVIAAATDREAVPVGKDRRADRGASRPGWRARVAFVLVAAIVALLGLAAYFGVQAVRHQADESDRADAVAAGRQAIVNLTSFGFQTAEADVARLADTSTPRFLQEFQQDRDSFVKLLRDGQVTTASEATEAGLAEIDGGTAKVLVSVRSTLRNLDAAQPENRTYRVSLSMVRQDERWLADRVEFMP